MEYLHKIDRSRMQALETLFSDAYAVSEKQDKLINELIEERISRDRTIQQLRRSYGRDVVFQVDRQKGQTSHKYRILRGSELTDVEDRILTEEDHIDRINAEIESARSVREAMQERVDETQVLVDSCRAFLEETRT